MKLLEMNTYRLDEIRTARLLLTCMRESDLADLCGMYRDPRVMATLGGVRSEEQTRELLERHLANWAAHGLGWWVVRELATGRFAGRGGLRYCTIDGCQEIEVSYGFLPEFWGRGLATELAAESVRVAFETLRQTEMVSLILPSNAASRRVLEKCGFRYERDVIHADLPHALYRLTAAAWYAAAPGGRPNARQAGT
jgi:[ribosomal protein S5]-alanine N-acetyltransferase